MIKAKEEDLFPELSEKEKQHNKEMALLNSESNIYLVVAILNYIEKELLRLYWNINQKEMDSPFQNTGNTYSNPVFSVRAYDWDENIEPNFQYGDFKVWWYKHSNRGVYFETTAPFTVEFLREMLKNCLKAMLEDKSLQSYI